MQLPALPELPLPPGVRSRQVDNNNGLSVHLLEAGFEAPGRPRVLLLHGFPELAYSWRKLMLPLAQAGYHVIAPDQRGYGRSTGWDASFDADLAPYRMANLVQDMLGLLYALGHRSVAAVVGHDFGAPVAAWCSLLRPDVFPAVVMMSAPFGGAPTMPFDTADHPMAKEAPDIQHDLAALPRPRKHYQWYYATRQANEDMWHCRQGVSSFLRAYYHVKSADWAGNQPFPLRAWSASELVKLPSYYIMDRDLDMAETVARHMPSDDEVRRQQWLREVELRVYASEYERTGFQGGLQWYRVKTEPRFDAGLRLYGGRSIDVPALFMAGAQDWGIWQSPGALQRMQGTACTQLVGVHLVPGAGHWVQQEQPDATARHLLDFLAQLPTP